MPAVPALRNRERRFQDPGHDTSGRARPGTGLRHGSWGTRSRSRSRGTCPLMGAISPNPRFKGKVVLAIVTGTWCTNCHDEAKYLVQLYQQYHAKGVEIVALDFEEDD